MPEKRKKKTVDLFWGGSPNRCAILFLIKGNHKSKYSGYGDDGHYDAIFLSGNV